MASLLEFTDVRDFLRDLIEICGTVENSDTPESEAREQVIGSLRSSVEPRGGEAKDKLAQESDIAEQPLEPLFEKNDKNTEEAYAQGYATALWINMTESISEDDPDGLNTAFHNFLARLDAEFDALRSDTPMKRVG